MLNYKQNQSKDQHDTIIHETKIIVLLTKVQNIVPTEILMLTYTEKYKKHRTLIQTEEPDTFYEPANNNTDEETI